MKSSLQSPLKWVLGIDDITIWKILVFSGAASLFLACLMLPTPFRKILVIGASVTSATAKITALATKATMERRGVELALLTEAYYESFARGVSPSRNEFYEEMRPIDASVVAPLKLLEIPWHDFDKIPHLFILAETGCGKTTTISAIIDRIPGDILMIDPHATKLSWKGFEVFGRPNSRDEIQRLMVALHAEMMRRYKEREDWDADEYAKQAPPITLIIDETPIAKDAIAEDIWQDMVAKLLREARKVRIRVIILSQGEAIDALGFKGMSEIKKNFSTLRGGDFAKDHAKSIKNQDLWVWLNGQERPWTFGALGVEIPYLAGFKPTPRGEMHESSLRVVAEARKVAEAPKHPPPTIGTKGISKPMPPGINLVKSPEDSKKVDEISLDIIESKILKYCYKRGECTVGDVQKNNSIGGKFNLNAKTILSIFEALSQRGDVVLEANESASYTKIIARNEARDAR